MAMVYTPDIDQPINRDKERGKNQSQDDASLAQEREGAFEFAGVEQKRNTENKGPNGSMRDDLD